MKRSIGDSVAGVPTQGAEAFWTFTIVIVLIGVGVSLATPSLHFVNKMDKARGGQRSPFSVFYKTDAN